MSNRRFCTKISEGAMPFEEIATRLSMEEGRAVSVYGVRQSYSKAMRKLRVAARHSLRFRRLLTLLTATRGEQERGAKIVHLRIKGTECRLT
jgi:hypothetical protein